MTPVPGEEHLTADFGLNWVPPTDSTHQPGDATVAHLIFVDHQTVPTADDLAADVLSVPGIGVERQVGAVLLDGPDGQQRRVDGLQAFSCLDP